MFARVPGVQACSGCSLGLGFRVLGCRVWGLGFGCRVSGGGGPCLIILSPKKVSYSPEEVSWAGSQVLIGALYDEWAEPNTSPSQSFRRLGCFALDLAACPASDAEAAYISNCPL